jgi:hypothetical protein
MKNNSNNTEIVLLPLIQMDLKIYARLNLRKQIHVLNNKIGEVNIRKREVDVCMMNHYTTPAKEADTGGF